MTVEQTSRLVVQAVRSLLGETPIRVTMVESGNSNHVARVDVRGGVAVAVRLSKVGADRFSVEQRVMAAASGVGVPVPRVRYVGDLPGRPDTAVMISDWIDARPLSTAAHATADRRHVAAALAQVLADIHSIPVHGFGNLDASLTGPATEFAEWFVDGAMDKITASAKVVAGHAPEAADLPGRAATILARDRAIFDGVPAMLAHGDFSPNNVLFADNGLAAVLDWEAAKGGPAALDLGWLAFVDPTHIVDREAIGRVYAKLTDQDPIELAQASRLVELRILATTAEWQARAERTGELPDTLSRLRTLISDLE